MQYSEKEARERVNSAPLTQALRDLENRRQDVSHTLINCEFEKARKDANGEVKS